jgi:transposase
LAGRLRLSGNKYLRSYPAELRGRVVAWARQRLEAGAAMDEVCRELDIGRPTLRRFLGTIGSTRSKRRGHAMFTRLKIRRTAEPTLAPPSSRLLVRGPSGLVIEGLSLDDVAQLVQRLSCSV